VAVEDYSRGLLTDRPQGQFPLSIATSLAIEGMLGIMPDKPPPADPEIDKTELLMVNVRTLLRNLYGSIPTGDRPMLDEYTIAEAISNEMRTIESIIAEKSDGRCFCQFYYCSYIDSNRKFSKGLIKPLRTPSQQFYWKMEKTVMGFLRDEFKSGPGIKEFVTEFEDANYSTLIITHYPVDLLQRYRFSSLMLLESFTGAIKPPLMWNTKLQNGEDIQNLPFDRMTLQMFGDGVMFSPMPIKIRERVLQVALKDRWTPARTKDFVIASITNRRDPALEVLVKELYRN
jgi:hypothetical protein